MVGGLLLSQVLTLYTTPVIYIFFDNLAQRVLQQEVGSRASGQRAAAGRAVMNISAPFIHRPVATTLLTVAIALAGAIAFTVLPVSPLPQVDFPTISVQCRPAGSQRGDHGLVGRHSAGAAVRPHRRRHGDDLVEQPRLTSITIQFDLSRNIDGAARDVQAAINAARTYLPANLPGNPTYRKVNPADAPIMILGADLGQVRSGQAVRRGLHHHSAEAFADSRVWAR